jgi:hypothetical protein
LPGARTNPKKRKKESQRDDEFRQLARKHLAHDFPNPERKGCPPDAELRGLAERPRKAKKTVLQHIATCSPCYRVYSRFLRARQPRRLQEHQHKK